MNRRHTYYWEYVDPGRAAAAREASDVEESLLAQEINDGRELLLVRLRQQPDGQTVMDARPEVSRIAVLEEPEDQALLYAEPLAVILQAAAYIGLDIATLLETAIALQRGTLAIANQAARERVHLNG